MKGLMYHRCIRTSKAELPYGQGPANEPGFWLVKDDGIYIMPAGWDESVGEKAANSQHKIVFATGYNPKTDEDVWEKSRAAAGGDDFAEFVGLTSDIVERVKATGRLLVTISETEIRLEA